MWRKGKKERKKQRDGQERRELAVRQIEMSTRERAGGRRASVRSVVSAVLVQHLETTAGCGCQEKRNSSYIYIYIVPCSPVAVSKKHQFILKF